MAPAHLAPFVPRLRRGLAFVVLALMVTATVGCSHHRSSLRPVYISPAPATAVPCPSPAVPAPGGGATLSSPVLEPAAPSLESPTALPAPMTGPAPATVTPPRPSSPSEEPALESIPENRPRATPGPAPELNAPNTSLQNGRRIPFSRLRQRQAALRERLRPFVNDPEDLFQPPKADRPWKYIVLHHSASPSGNYDVIDREHRKVLGWDGCGYHFIIGNGTGSPDGQVEVAQRWSNQKHGVHCRNGKTPEVNEYGIGICLVGDLDKSPPTPRQVAAAQALIAYLGDRYQIPPDHIGTHARLANSPTACPGKHFPEQAILGSLNHLAQR